MTSSEVNNRVLVAANAAKLDGFENTYFALLEMLKIKEEPHKFGTTELGNSTNARHFC